MRISRYILLLLLIRGLLTAQTAAFRENGKWGLSEKGVTRIPAVYDTLVYNDSTGSTCLACYKVMSASANKFIKVLTKSYHCNYLNKSGERLVVKTSGNDTCSVFSLAKHTVRQFTENATYFTAGLKNRKFLIDRNFQQLSFGNYYDISFSADPGFLIARISNDGVIAYTGLLNRKEEEIIPFLYSDIKVNPWDSLIIACSGSLRPGAEDDVYTYEGKKTGAYHRHVELATKNFIIHKLYEPKEVYVIYHLQTKEEKNLTADEALLQNNDELRIRIKNDWYIYNMAKGEKKPLKQS